MIYLFHGSDVGKVRAKAFAWVASARAKAPEVTYMRIDADELSTEVLQDITQTQGLFFTKTLALLDDPFATADTTELVFDALDILRDSQNPIALLAPKLTAPRLKKLEKHAEKIFVFDAKEKTPARGFNSGLVNALGSKNSKALWKEITVALRQGDAPEAIHGLLHWKARDMMQKGSPMWGKDGARVLSRDLIELVSSARSGEDLPLSAHLERCALSIR